MAGRSPACIRTPASSRLNGDAGEPQAFLARPHTASFSSRVAFAADRGCSYNRTRPSKRMAPPVQRTGDRARDGGGALGV